jgi:hypothetical protein
MDVEVNSSSLTRQQISTLEEMYKDRQDSRGALFEVHTPDAAGHKISDATESWSVFRQKISLL